MPKKGSLRFNKRSLSNLCFIIHMKNGTLKGTVARDCRPLVFFMNRPHMGL